MDKSLLRQYAYEGLTRKEIAERMGMSYSRITTVLRDIGIKLPRKTYEHPIIGPRDQTAAILGLRNEGKSYGEIAALMGIKKDTVTAACIRWGANGFAPGKENKVVTTKEIEDNIARCGFEYVGGYINGKSAVTVRCPVCGGEFERLYHIFRDKVNGTWKFGCECPLCRQERTKQRKEQRKAEHEREAQKRAQMKAERLSRTVNEELTKRLAIHVCKNCGIEFSQMVTGYNSKTYCSEKCQNRYFNRRRCEKRYKTLMAREHNSDISLEKLFKRDRGICYLCGKPCDWTDGEERDGTFIAGSHYPSIDHIVPVSKGGTHTWDNIKLACRQCNWEKRDSV